MANSNTLISLQWNSHNKISLAHMLLSMTNMLKCV